MTRCIIEITEDQRVVLDAQIATQLTQLAAWDRARTVLAYLAMTDEVNLESILRAAHGAGKQVGLPRIENGGRDMKFKLVDAIDDDALELERHRYGFLQPVRNARDVSMHEDTLVLVPGRAFDRQGFRVGRGKGYYDRFLGSIDSSIVTVGVGYACQLKSGLPHEPWDVPVQIVVTDREFCFCHRKN